MKQTCLSAGAVIVHGAGDARLYLVMRCFQYWDFPKGMVEAGESPFIAAQREIREEASLDQLDFPWGEVFTETAPYGAGKVARYYLAVSPTQDVTLGISAELGFPEHDEYRWLPYDECRALLGARVRAVLEWAHALSGQPPADAEN
ncbi:MAG: NUDIX domain-containing protein [Pseudomonadota bacterium]